MGNATARMFHFSSSEGLFDDGGLTEVGAICCNDWEGVWEGENITFDETVSGEYLITNGVRQEGKESNGRELTNELC